MYTWVPYPDLDQYERAARKHKVSVVARGRGGFMRVYQQAHKEATRESDGRKQETASVLSKAVRRMRSKKASVNQSWSRKRRNFIARHLKQYNANPTFRRYLALLMWAYKPCKRRAEFDRRVASESA